MRQSKQSRILLMVILYGTMFLFGFLENIKGVSYPLIKNEFTVSYETQGKMISVLSFSYTLFVVVSGFILGRYGVKKVYLFGLLCALGGVFSIYFMPGFWTAALSLLLLFAGFGVFEIGVNGVATQIFTEKGALMMSLLHFMYGLGAIISPKAAGILADPAGAALGWRQMYLLTVPLVLLILVPAIFTRFPAAKDAAQSNAPDAAKGSVPNTGNVPRFGFTAALRTSAVWAFGITLGLMMGIEMASSNWGGLYFQDVYGMNPATSGANFVSAFFLLFTLSRLVSGFIIERAGYMRSLVGAAAIAAAIFIAGFALGARGIYVLPAAGFFIAVWWPTFMAFAMGRFGERAPVMCSAVIAIGGLLNAGMQLAMGYINRYAGAAWGYRSCLGFSLILLCVLPGVNKLRIQKETGAPPQKR
ncbi:MAG: MFS transporter [Treponema sp.]|jgi:fucose permease|nr:MFS transporter [Treponema sp.]